MRRSPARRRGPQLNLVDVMRHSRYKKVETALGYMEVADRWRNNITEPARRRG
jgi:hypothetical protein